MLNRTVVSLNIQGGLDAHLIASKERLRATFGDPLITSKIQVILRNL